MRRLTISPKTRIDVGLGLLSTVVICNLVLLGVDLTQKVLDVLPL